MRSLFCSYTITGRGVIEWQQLIQTLPDDVGKRLQEIFRPEQTQKGHNYIIMKAHGYYWSYTYDKGYLTVIVQPAPPDHPDGRAYKDEFAPLLNKRCIDALLVIQH